MRVGETANPMEGQKHHPEGLVSIALGCLSLVRHLISEGPVQVGRSFSTISVVKIVKVHVGPAPGPGDKRALGLFREWRALGSVRLVVCAW
jgi:hypothetical protein